jgi:dTDP-N-acetylfucosamine:lipid II N-acetylfucosaminyltransferase
MIYTEFEIVHIADDQKVVDAAFSRFERVFPGKNILCLLKGASDIKHVKSRPRVEFTTLDLVLGRGRDVGSKAKVVVFYSLTKKLWKLYEALNIRCRIVWLGFGVDYYDIIDDDEMSQYTQKTRKVVQDSRWAWTSVISLWRQKNWTRRKQEGILPKVSYFSGFPGEIEMLHSRCQNFKAVSFPYCFTDFDDVPLATRGGFGGREVFRVVLGNSASPANNHLEAIDCLAEMQMRSRVPVEVIIPLAYGDKRYAVSVVDYARRKLNRIVLLTQFKCYREYIEMLASCNLAIFNHKRQMAVGTILALMKNGVRLVLNDESIVYKFLSCHGCSLDALSDVTPVDLLNRLRHEDVQYNRQFAAEFWGREVLDVSLSKALSDL